MQFGAIWWSASHSDDEELEVGLSPPTPPPADSVYRVILVSLPDCGTQAGATMPGFPLFILSLNLSSLHEQLNTLKYVTT